jgi:CRP-like cAMP-binding protein
VAGGAAVVVAGDVATEMYFIHDGEAEVLAADGRAVATLGPGEFFGEDALLTVRAALGAVTRPCYA